MVDLHFSEEQLALQKLCKDFSDQEIKPVVADLDKISDPQEVLEKFPWDVIRKGSALGLRTAALPVEHGQDRVVFRD